MAAKKPNRYEAILERIFFHADYGAYDPSKKQIEFEREDLERAADELEIKLPKNLGDLLYSFRFRNALPQSIVDTERDSRSWVIMIEGRAKYAFRLFKENKIEPREDLVTVKVPDATPEVIRLYAQGDEQALLAIVRYNRLIDTFLGITTYSLQNHLRTTVASTAQIEIDELYIGIDKRGGHHIIPVQAKGGSDKISVVQSYQDVTWCRERFPHLRTRLISAQFMGDDRIAMFELAMEEDFFDLFEIDEKAKTVTEKAKT